MSMDEWMDKENEVSDGILLSHKEENPVIYHNMDELWGHHVKWNQPVIEGQILLDATYMKYLRGSNPKKQVEWWLPGAGEGGKWETCYSLGVICHARWKISRGLLYNTMLTKLVTMYYALKILLRVDLMLHIFLSQLKRKNILLTATMEGSVVTAWPRISRNSKFPPSQWDLESRKALGGGVCTSFQSTHNFPISTHTELGRRKASGTVLQRSEHINLIPNWFPDLGPGRKNPDRTRSGQTPTQVTGIHLHC